MTAGGAMNNTNASGHYVEVQGLVKLFGSDRAVDGVSFGVPKGKFLTLLGPSGCGKTTTLMSIAGLHSIDAGTIRVGGVTYTAPAEGLFLPPEKRDIGMVFQSYAIWPHMTVAQNVAYPLEIRKVAREEIDARVAGVLKLVGLGNMADRLATQLSGGQQQRAALARAIVSRPRLLLFDEPLSNLDLKLREQMRLELKRIQHEVGITSIYVTHDQAEALVMSDEIIVMSKGRIQQRGSPREIYAPAGQRLCQQLHRRRQSAQRPRDLRDRARPRRGRDRRRLAQGRRWRAGSAPASAAGAEAVISVRPENVEATRQNGGGPCSRRRSDPGDLPRQLRRLPRALGRVRMEGHGASAQRARKPARRSICGSIPSTLWRCSHERVAWSSSSI